jgi:maltose 6'-phosphate phosphatase
VEWSLLTLNLHTYQQHVRECPLETMHLHEREVGIVAEAMAQQRVDMACFQEVGEWVGDPATQPYGYSPSNMAWRIGRRLREWGIWYHLHQDWSHVGFGRFREGTAILSRHALHHCHSAVVSLDGRKDWYMARNVTMACAEVWGFGLLHVANVHLSWAHHGFHHEFERVRRLVESRRWQGFRGDVLAGDFNAPAGEAAYRHVVGSGEYVDQFWERHPHRFHEPSHWLQAHGWEQHAPSRLDYLFKRAGSPMRIQSIDWIFNGQFYPGVSDHYGLLSRFELH